MGIESPRKNTGSGGTTERYGDKRIIEYDPIFHQKSLYIWHYRSAKLLFYITVYPSVANGVPALIVRVEDHYVWQG